MPQNQTKPKEKYGKKKDLFKIVFRFNLKWNKKGFSVKTSLNNDDWFNDWLILTACQSV